MKPEWAEDFPRLYELYSESDHAKGNNYFDDFDKIISYPHSRSKYKILESELEQIDDAAWQAFKKRALPYVTVRDTDRQWQQLFDAFDEVKGCLWLKSKGCDDIRFIPKGSETTPDLRARCGTYDILMEVKTINMSDAEILYRRSNSEIGSDGLRHMQAREIGQWWNDSVEPLKKKIMSTYEVARQQLRTPDFTSIHRRIALFVIHFDLCLSLDSQIFDEFLANVGLPDDKGIEVVFVRAQ